MRPLAAPRERPVVAAPIEPCTAGAPLDTARTPLDTARTPLDTARTSTGAPGAAPARGPAAATAPADAAGTPASAPSVDAGSIRTPHSAVAELACNHLVPEAQVSAPSHSPHRGSATAPAGRHAPTGGLAGSVPAEPEPEPEPPSRLITAGGGSTNTSSHSGAGQGPTLPCVLLGMHDLVLLTPAPVEAGPDDDDRVLHRADKPGVRPD